MTATDTDRDSAERSSASSRKGLGEHRWRFLLLLGLPALGLTFAITVVSTYAPVLLGAKSSPLLVGVIVGGEGFFGLIVPLAVGAVTDRHARVAQDRLRALLIVTPVAVGGLLVLAIPGSLVLIAVGAALYFTAHFAFLAPFQALYADLVPDDTSGRSRSVESIWRLAGAGVALIAGGFLIEAWKPSPFLAGAVLIAVGTLVFWRFLRRTDDVPVSGGDRGLRELRETATAILRRRDIRLLVLGNVLWNLTLSGLRAFVVLFFTLGLGRSPSFVSGVVFPLVALGLAASAPLSGKAGDKWGHLRVLQVAVPIYGLGLLLPAFWHGAWVLAVVPIVAAAAATVMVVPFAALMRMMSEEDHGAVSGVFTLSRGLGTMLGPLLTGTAILLLRGPFSDTKGFGAMWLVIGAATLASWPLLAKMRR
ncbi:MAG TPA: MFS transporter [Mycobacteriales bacterium]|nr:MFS transporter [Mycobacteriales bacterium]